MQKRHSIRLQCYGNYTAIWKIQIYLKLIFKEIPYKKLGVMISQYLYGNLLGAHISQIMPIRGLLYYIDRSRCKYSIQYQVPVWNGKNVVSKQLSIVSFILFKIWDINNRLNCYLHNNYTRRKLAIFQKLTVLNLTELGLWEAGSIVDNEVQVLYR